MERAGPPATARPADDAPLSLSRMGAAVLFPTLGFYLLRLAGLEPFAALLVTTGLSGVGAIGQAVRSRRPLGLDAAMLLFALAGIGQSLIHGSPRFLLAIDSCLTATGGVWFLMTARTERPLAFVISRAMLEGTMLGRRLRLPPRSWATLWQGDPRFRRIWRVSTVVWGLGAIADAVIRLAMAITLPVDVVPGLNAILYPATFVLLQVITNTYYHRTGLWDILGNRRPGAQLAHPH